ncbi:MAG: RNA polymerase sigma factor [Bacteroidota bacterium]
MKLIIEKSGTKESLIAGCLKKQRQAQQELYDWLAPKMLGLCRRYIHDHNEAESVMIAGFIKVFDKIEQFSGDGNFEGWVRRIMVNESLLYIRKHKNMYIEVDIEYADRKPDYNLASTNLEVDELVKLINNLPIGYRTVFNMYAIEGYSHKEIAKTLNISENTSKSQLSRARKMLQVQLLKKENLWEEKSRRDGKA